MSSSVTQPVPISSHSAAQPGCTRPGARARRVTVHRRLGQATDALALADLLLALNLSVGSLDGQGGKGRP